MITISPRPRTKFTGDLTEWLRPRHVVPACWNQFRVASLGSDLMPMYAYGCVHERDSLEIEIERARFLILLTTLCICHEKVMTKI